MLKLGVVMGFSSLKTVLIFMILPLSSSGKALDYHVYLPLVTILWFRETASSFKFEYNLPPE